MSGRTQAYDASAPHFQASSAGANAALGRYRSMTQSPDSSHDQAYNRDQDQKAGSPQRMAQEPQGAEGSARSPKTATDPASGEPSGKGTAPNQAKTDQIDGAKA